MKKFKLLGIILIAMLSISLLFGCSSKEQEPGNPKSDTTNAPNEHKVALILSGPISDMSWNATAYNGLKEIEKLGAEIAYQESVDNSSLADVINNYATGGYDLIFLSTNSYEDIGLKEAKNYPDVTFIIINGATTVDNVVSVQVADEHQGFLMGAISALVANEGQVGFVGGIEITPIINGSKGFEAGAKHVNDKVLVNSAMTGSMTDVNAAKETAKAMIDKGVTAIAPMADNASLGVLEAAQEAGILAIASGLNQEQVASKSVIVAVVKDTAIAYKAAYEDYINGKLAKETKKMGAAEGVVFLSDWYEAAAALSQETKDAIKAVFNDLASGKIAVNVS